jgi:hypothetical protein
MAVTVTDSQWGLIDAYIHLNPIRVGMVKDLKSLAKYDKSGHA